MNTAQYDAQLVIIGAGPAGCSAALMAASLGLTSVIVEATGSIGGKLAFIKASENIPGGWLTGPDLAAALTADLNRISSGCHLITGLAQAVASHDDRVEVLLADGRTVTGETAVIATGVHPRTASEAAWIKHNSSNTFSPLWRARPADLSGPAAVLGADRPLGTWLRGHPEFDGILDVFYTAEDKYKVDEVFADARVRLHLVESIEVDGAAPRVITAHPMAGRLQQFTADTVLLNLGSAPGSLPGLVQGPDGYCPPESQHARITTAGDLRSARYQRVITAQGSGAQAVLTHYYSTALTPPARGTHG
ncbi:NAD(P)/FAD-dependent oxidoreductase [Kitasatospora sp. RB6PN24]|uniref:NAD(P)/FAD-dependent oxidoreductase n=1 Tax=Kitasatospora humi TaxID=2893891 RepID=UPI001E5D7544|nr:NAD(P)/FAD-dependent oxidoreductase [Kitasatospora humi]MCC9312353.1 NAD(P)/FAD-dependent oxidoreductase [Kitasatospora humi]